MVFERRSASQHRSHDCRLGDEVPNLERTAALEGTRTMHEVVLSGLEPATKYFWQALSVTADGDTPAEEASR